MSLLFSPYPIRSLTLRNRIVMSPMCMYSATEDGVATDWHLVHYGARAAGGVGLILLEATAVEPRGRISTRDLGLWDPAQLPALERIVRFVHEQGAACGVQLAHAGRKAFSAQKGHGPQEPVAPSSLPFAPDWRAPAALDEEGLEQVAQAFVQAARWAHEVGFDVIELHMAHGYLLHEFLSPLANHRTDRWGGSLEGRMAFPLEVARRVRAVWPAEKPLFARISTTDYAPGGFDPDQAVEVARQLAEAGVDLVDCSSGGLVPVAPPTYPGYQLGPAERIRREAGVPVGAVGLITTPEMAEEVLQNGRADLIFLGRELLRHPHWPLDAARALGAQAPWPHQYHRAKRPGDQ
ncbi:MULTISPECIES: NADPH dehydrogenase NamA [Limnochorda]|uniref:NADPH dehydrogenase NamA n=1 Tax=Limnochorda TaxID=1676651 RepID=UPI001DA8EAAF|nr:NADPH dehydrogenase NamA [Limnochorda pilosa]MBO2487149.1 NADPH dehydrogenase NamA [Bacillota bacterium]MBO2518379.1 NADPH dehydrogenase NamA [Bacillota bacterium]